MNLSLSESATLAKAIKPSGLLNSSADISICVPFTALGVVSEILSGSSIKLGAQDVFWEKAGAFTGEISAVQLADAGCQTILIGHSERRKIFGETNVMVQKKIAAALSARLTPIVCIGETLEERESQTTWDVLKTQIKEGLFGLSAESLASLVIAYEPIWAIGTGKTATPDQAQEAHAFIRKTLAQIFADEFAQKTRVIYGGSVNVENIDSLMAEPDLDGVLVGGASLKADSFLRIIRFQPLQLRRALGEINVGK